MSARRVKLTKSFIDQLELTPAIYRDSDLIGFAVRVNNSYKTYIVEKKVLGRAVRSTLGLHGNITLVQAREMARERLLEMSKGINPNDVKRQKTFDNEKSLNAKKQKPTVKEAFDHYMDHKTLKSKTVSDYKIVIDKYLKDWHHINLDEVSSKMIQEKHQLLSEGSEARANMAMRVFRAVYNFSVEHYLDDDQPILIPYNPVKTLSAQKAWNKIKRRKTYINEEQIPDWINAIFTYQDRGQLLETNRDFLLTLVLTGFRREECESLSWESVDLKYGVITSLNTKSGQSHTLPMGDFLLELMKKRRRQIQGEWVFPSVKSASGHIVNISKVRAKINAICKIKFTFHDLRRTFGSIAENLDYGHYTINRLLNRKKDDDSSDATSEYIQINDKKLREAMNLIEDTILGEYKAIHIARMKCQ